MIGLYLTGEESTFKKLGYPTLINRATDYNRFPGRRLERGEFRYSLGGGMPTIQTQKTFYFYYMVEMVL